MTDNEYLKKILEAQTLDSDGKEMKELRSRRDDAEKLLRKKIRQRSEYSLRRLKGERNNDKRGLRPRRYLLF